MEKPSVTLRYDTFYLVGGLMLLLAALIAGLASTSVDQQSQRLSMVVAVLTAIFGVVCFLWGVSVTILNENGIFIKRPFYSKQYSWSDVEKVTIRWMPAKGGKRPEISLKIANRKTSLAIEYTKRTMACVTCYYGEPDLDKWGKPPVYM